MKELWAERQEIEQEIAFARMEAAMDALPESYAEGLEINRSLRAQLGALTDRFDSLATGVAALAPRFLVVFYAG
jgi:uncharacterized coiled-coil protein SlyX